MVVIEVEASVLASLETELHRYCNRARKSGAVVCSVRSSEFRSSSMAWFAVQLDRRQDCELRRIGGRGGIRTHGALAGTPVFKTGALNHSATLPCVSGT